MDTMGVPIFVIVVNIYPTTHIVQKYIFLFEVSEKFLGFNCFYVGAMISNSSLFKSVGWCKYTCIPV